MVKPSDPPPRRYSRALQMMCTDESVAYQSGLLSLVHTAHTARNSHDLRIECCKTETISIPSKIHLVYAITIDINATTNS